MATSGGIERGLDWDWGGTGRPKALCGSAGARGGAERPRGDDAGRREPGHTEEEVRFFESFWEQAGEAFRPGPAFGRLERQGP
jgi:hypothetical protein